MKGINPTQTRILALVKQRKGDLRELSLRDIGEAIDIGRNPQTVAHHIAQLEKKGLLRRDTTEAGVFHLSAEGIPAVAAIRLYSVTAQCGPDGRFGEDEIIDWIPLPTKTFGIADPDRFFLIRARGDSMEPLIREQDLVLGCVQPEVRSGTIAIVVHDQVLKIKKLDTEHRVLISLNPRYPLEQLAEGDATRIIGPVKGVIRTGKLL